MKNIIIWNTMPSSLVEISHSSSYLPLLHTHHSPPPEVRDSLKQAVHYHSLGPSVRRFISALALARYRLHCQFVLNFTTVSNRMVK